MSLLIPGLVCIALPGVFALGWWVGVTMTAKVFRDAEGKAWRRIQPDGVSEDIQ